VASSLTDNQTNKAAVFWLLYYSRPGVASSCGGDGGQSAPDPAAHGREGRRLDQSTDHAGAEHLATQTGEG